MPNSAHQVGTWVTHIHEPDCSTPCLLPLFLVSVSAGFPSPADDFLDSKLDLNAYLIRRPAATFHLRVAGDSMMGAGILSGDIVVVDRSIDPCHYNGHIIVAILNGELTIKRLQLRQGQPWLLAENDQYPPIEISEAIDFEIFGVVVGVVRKLCSPKSLPW
jgi:DNA polymerase V